MILESTIILMLSFGYRRYIIRTGTAYVRLPPRKVVWCWCVIAYLSIAPLWVSTNLFSSLWTYIFSTYPTQHYASDPPLWQDIFVALITLHYHASSCLYFKHIISSGLYDFDMRVVIVVSFALLFTPIATLVMLVLRKSLINHLSKMVRLIERIASIWFTSEQESSGSSWIHHSSNHFNKKKIYLSSQALTYQMILPIGFLITVLAWFIDFSTIESGHLVQRLIFVIVSLWIFKFLENMIFREATVSKLHLPLSIWFTYRLIAKCSPIPKYLSAQISELFE